MRPAPGQESHRIRNSSRFESSVQKVEAHRRRSLDFDERTVARDRSIKQGSASRQVGQVVIPEHAPLVHLPVVKQEPYINGRRGVGDQRRSNPQCRVAVKAVEGDHPDAVQRTCPFPRQ